MSTIRNFIKLFLINILNISEEKLRFLRIYIVVGLRYFFIKTIRLREHLPIVSILLDLKGEGAEIGVFRGWYSNFILKYSKLSKLYSIDIWEGSLQEKRYRIVYNTFNKKYKNRSKILRMSSREASKLFKPKTLDFVYIDANHSYEACKEDIDLWWSKVKNGGIFSGDDYEDSTEKNWGVKKAVDEFAEKKRQIVFNICEPHGHRWWYLIKHMEPKRLLILKNFLKTLLIEIKS